MHFFTRSPWIMALGSSLINSLWQMALVWLVFTLITATYKRFSASARHALAIACLSLGSGWFIMSLFQTMGQPANPSTGLAGIILNPETTLTKAFYTGRKWVDDSLPYFSFTYLVVIFLMLLRHAIYYRRLKEMRSLGLHRIQPRLKLFAANTAAHLGIRKKVMVWLSESIDTPVTIGFFKPIILIPLATINHLTIEQVEAVLLHELSHIRRNDYLINLFITWAGIVFFFNPFSRLLIRHIRREREHCCDDLVLQFQYNPQDYALALLSLEKKRQQDVGLALAAIGKNQPLLLERVKRLTGQPETSRRFSLSLMLFLLFSLLLAVGMMANKNENTPHRVLTYQHVKRSAPEIFTVKYVTPPPASEKRSVKITRKYKQSNSSEDQVTEEEAHFAISGNNEQGDEAGAAIAPVVHSEKRDFSMITSVESPGIPDAADVNLPYVPTTSYFYQIQDDTFPRSMTEESDGDQRYGEKSLHSMKQIDLMKIEKKIPKNKKPVGNSIQNGLKLSFLNPDGQGIFEQNNRLLSEADEKRLRESIDLQVETYNNIKTRTPGQARILQIKIRQGQLRLKQDYLEKQLQTVQKQQEHLRKIARIVYI